MGENPLKVGIVGSRKYENRKKIKEFIFKLKEEKGVDLGLQYEEYPPAHKAHNLYCPLHERNYGKPYSVKNFFARNKQIAIHSEYVVAFIPRGDKAKGSMSTIDYAKKFGKKTLVID